MENMILLLLAAIAVLIVRLRIKNIRLSQAKTLLAEEKSKCTTLLRQNKMLHCEIDKLQQQRPFLLIRHQTEQKAGA